MKTQFLRIYLNDHFAAALGGLELARRVFRRNRHKELGRSLKDLVSEIESDRAALRDIMSALHVGKSVWKQGAAWMAEKAGRLKLNGRLIRHSPLSELVELEGLSLGIEGKRLLWLSLGAIRTSMPQLERFDFEFLAARAQRQRDRVESERLFAAERALLLAELPRRGRAEELAPQPAL